MCLCIIVRDRLRQSATPNGAILMKRTVLVVFITLLTLTLSACNTVEGVGQDIEALGRGTSDVARDTNPYDL